MKTLDFVNFSGFRGFRLSLDPPSSLQPDGYFHHIPAKPVSLPYSYRLSVGTSDAGILASDYCDAPTDTSLLIDNWQPLPAAKQRKTDTLTCCCHRLFTFYKSVYIL